ncbi:Txe/YoeB family addiction module toxin [Rubrivirga sp. S365]|uniref:Txe/YoeB family addiction module toxin n=1 Tax=Rubrivirga sp. S365 TaxID=3076080 RepID=UPI0028C6A6A0|nr:Txe/YoeB family addiction module toxin [Rubrivirga sp. S365]MDT7858329.1 Txe/YoeB family addiction module toxin [Rubrivirga sp. S365]
MRIRFSARAFEEFSYWLDTDRRRAKRIRALLKDIQRGPFEGIGKPEPLKGDLSGFWSRRIDDTHRVVYRVEGDTVDVAQCKG